MSKLVYGLIGAVLLFLIGIYPNSIFGEEVIVTNNNTSIMTISTNTTIAKTYYFSMNVPDTWVYATTVSDSPITKMLGFGIADFLLAMPSEFADIVNEPTFNISKLLGEGFAMLGVSKDNDYPLKNAPLTAYTEYKVNKIFHGLKPLTLQSLIIDNEDAMMFNGTFTKEFLMSTYGNSTATTVNSLIPEFALSMTVYTIIHNKEPYVLMYMGTSNTGHYQKYLPEVEPMARSIKWIHG